METITNGTTPSPSIPAIQPLGRPKRHGRRGLLLAVVSIVVAAVVIGSIFYVKNMNQKPSIDVMTASQNVVYQQALDVASRTKGLDPVTQSVQLSGAASLMENAGQHDKSLAFYLQAQKIVDTNNLRESSSIDFSQQIAEEYVKLGNKTKAKQYYQKAIDFVKSQKNMVDADKQVKSLETERDKL